jgi:hypothetical protein
MGISRLFQKLTHLKDRTFLLGDRCFQFGEQSIMHQDEKSYFKRRADQETVAALRASCEQAADVHRALAARYVSLAGDEEHAPEAMRPQVRGRLHIIA